MLHNKCDKETLIKLVVMINNDMYIMPLFRPYYSLLKSNISSNKRKRDIYNLFSILDIILPTLYCGDDIVGGSYKMNKKPYHSFIKNMFIFYLS